MTVVTGVGPAIGPGSKVSLHFSLALETGETIDSNFDGPAASLVIGDGTMLPGFEEALMGLKSGAEIAVLLPEQQAFGALNPKNIQQFPVEKFSHIIEDDLIPAQPGSVVSFKDPGGFDLPGVILTIDETLVKVDFNHPLAGKSIKFCAKIVNVIPADINVVEVKL